MKKTKKKTKAKNTIKKVIKKAVAGAKRESKIIKKEGKKLMKVAKKEWKASAPARKKLEMKAKKEAAYFITRTIDLAKQLDDEITRSVNASMKAKRTRPKGRERVKKAKR